MDNLQLKKDLHALIDQVENNDLLQSLISILRENGNQRSGDHWKLLSDQLKNEIFKSYEESEDEINLIAREDFLK